MSEKKATSRDKLDLRLQRRWLRLQCLKLALGAADQGVLRANLYAHRRDPDLVRHPLLEEELLADMLLSYVTTGTMLERPEPTTAYKPVEMTPEEQAAYERPEKYP